MQRYFRLSFHPSTFTPSCKTSRYYGLGGLNADTLGTKSDTAEIREHVFFIKYQVCEGSDAEAF